MARRLISSGSQFEKDVGYSRVVVDGEWAFVSGTTGFDYETMTISSDIVEQAVMLDARVHTAEVDARAHRLPGYPRCSGRSPAKRPG